jgi:hypothetical protein
MAYFPPNKPLARITDQPNNAGPLPTIQTTASDQATSSLAQAANIPSHAQVLTVTPLGGDDPVLMTHEQIGAYTPPKPKEEKAVERTVSERRAIVKNRAKKKRLKRTDPSTSLGVRFSARQPSGFGDMPTPAQLLTVTPLDNNATVVPMNLPDIRLHNHLLTQSEISTLAPRGPKRPESLDFGPITSDRSGTRIIYRFIVKGIAADSPFTDAIVGCFKHQNHQIEYLFSNFSSFKAKSTKDGSVEISFKSDDFSSAAPTIAHNLYLGVGNLFHHLHDLGVSEHDAIVWCRNDLIFANLSNADWHCENRADAIIQRGNLVRLLLLTGFFDLAFPLICDWADACHMTGMHHLFESRWYRQILPPNASALISNKYPITSKDFTDLAFKTLEENPQFLKCRHCLVQAGRLLLRSISDPDFQSDFHHTIRQRLFAAIGDFRMGCKTKEEAEALLRDLLDLPDDDRGELLLDLRARRLLLIAFPNFRLFEEIEGNAQEVFWDRIKALEDQGLVFSGNALANEPVEINGPTITPVVVNMLIGLAEAAVRCAGRINWAIGVLQFLSKRVLEEDQIESVVALRDRIQLTVKSDPQVESTFETVKKLTDEAIANFRKLND